MSKINLLVRMYFTFKNQISTLTDDEKKNLIWLELNSQRASYGKKMCLERTRVTVIKHH